MGLPVSEILLSEDATGSLARLRSRPDSDSRAKSIVRRVEAYRLLLKGDALHGEVAKKPLPKALVAKYGIDNLFVEDLPNFWRLLYTMVRRGNRRHLVILEIVDHPTYDKWFPSRGR